MHIYREGDIYAALRDTEIALMLCPAHKKALQRRLRCLYSLCWYEEAQRFLQEYKQSFPQDKEFYPKFHSELEKASSEAGETPSTCITETFPTPNYTQTLLNSPKLPDTVNLFHKIFHHHCCS